jgi:hypothetical protein
VHNEALSVAAMCVCNPVGYAKFYSRSHNAVVRVYDEAGKVDRRTTNTLGYCLAPVSIGVCPDSPVDLAANLAPAEVRRVHVGIGQPRTHRLQGRVEVARGNALTCGSRNICSGNRPGDREKNAKAKTAWLTITPTVGSARPA